MIKSRLELAAVALLVALALTLILASTGHSAIYGFQYIPNGNDGDGSLAEMYLSLDVTDPGLGEVDFTFINSAPSGDFNFFIDGVYFYDGVVLSPSGVSINANANTGVTFEEGANPAQLPGYNPGPLTVFYASDANALGPKNGVNPGERITFRFDLHQGVSFHDVLSALDLGILVAGVKVQGFEDEGSIAAITPPSQVPLPGAFWLLGTGALGLMGLRLRRKA